MAPPHRTARGRKLKGSLGVFVAADESESGFVKDSEVSTFARTFLDESDGRGVAAVLGAWKVLAASAVAITHTGVTAKTALATVNVPAGAMGLNGILRVTTLWSVTGSSNAKTVAFELGGSTFFGRAESGASTVAIRDQREINNRNSAASQVTMSSASAASFGVNTAAPTTRTVNTAIAQDLIFYATLASAGETITLESYTVELFYAA